MRKLFAFYFRSSVISGTPCGHRHHTAAAAMACRLPASEVHGRDENGDYDSIYIRTAIESARKLRAEGDES